MESTRKPYFLLFNAITDAVEAMEKQNFGQSRDLLIRAQQAAEELYLEETDTEEESEEETEEDSEEETGEDSE